MTVSSVTEILTAKTADTLVTEQLAVMAAADPPLPVTAYQPGSAALTLIEAEAEALADVHTTVGQLGASAFLGEATGDWLTLRAKSTFDLDRILATYTLGSVTLACSALAGPETITPGALVITTPSGLLYRSTNTTSITVASGGTASVPMRAEGSGTDYNVSLAGATIVTPAAAGLSVSAASGVSWITTTARNEETDAELVTRCRARWATLAFGAGTRAAYEYVLRSATMDNTETGTSCGVTRVGFAPALGTGAVGIAIAGSNGLLTDGQRDAVRTFVASRKPLTDTVTINHASTVAVNLSASTVRFKAGRNTLANRVKVQLAIENYVNALPMGDGGADIFVDESAIAYNIFASAPGLLIDVDLTCGDVAIPSLTVATVDTSVITFS